jgi:hypothetical protein
VKPLIVGASALFLWAVLLFARWQGRRRTAAAEDVRSEWEGVRHQIAKALDGHQGRTVVLITGFRVPSQAFGNGLCQALEARWSDRVEVEWNADGPSEPHWSVVSTSDTVVVTELLERQWLARMRTICETFGCEVSSVGVLWGGSPPTQVPPVPA